jgi:hypothetical protein|tara:strand:- start:2894 stop:3082 length:189 start_codon:yes stop_codon:yes gene_type:complete
MEKMETDAIATSDAKTIKRLVGSGEPLSSAAAGFGYTTSEAMHLLGCMAKYGHVPVNWWLAE